MRNVFRHAAAALIGAVLLTFASACNTHWEYKTTTGQASLANSKKWHDYLKVVVAPAGTPIGTTMTHISNVGYGTAEAKISQALQSYKDSLGYELTTVFQIGRTERATSKEGDNKPAITAMVIRHHLYYVAMLDYLEDQRAAYVATGELVPAVAVVDGEDETKPAWIQTKDGDGNPYKIKIRLREQANWDQNAINYFLRSHGYGTKGNCASIDSPSLEMDDNWRPYITVTYNTTDNCGNMTNGKQDWAVKLVVVDMQTEAIKEYKLDDPNTPENEADKIPEWIDQVYSSALIVEYIDRWGYNTDNYGKTSTINEFHADHDIIDEVMDAENKNIVFCAYITSTQADNALIGVMLIDPRTAHATFYKTRGDHAMATKSTAQNTIELATNRWGYHVEDLTLHYIYGMPTWVGELTLPFKNDNDQVIGEHYAGTVLVQADHDIQPAHVQWAPSKIQAFTKYEEFITLKTTERVGSNVSIDTTITARVSRVQLLNFDGIPSYLINLEGQDGLWEVKVPFIGDVRTEDALNLKAGDIAYLRYTDTVNRKTHLVKEVVDKSAKVEKALASDTLRIDRRK
ncbi:MAG: hypothetical protein JWN50_196 [Parcubacteria group bacterium]|nr:hypothetical protein [Parcubacteria group bacterium]